MGGSKSDVCECCMAVRVQLEQSLLSLRMVGHPSECEPVIRTAINPDTALSGAVSKPPSSVRPPPTYCM